VSNSIPAPADVRLRGCVARDAMTERVRAAVAITVALEQGDTSAVVVG
jgi:hypothetical protein